MSRAQIAYWPEFRPFGNQQLDSTTNRYLHGKSTKRRNGSVTDDGINQNSQYLTEIECSTLVWNVCYDFVTICTFLNANDADDLWICACARWGPFARHEWEFLCYFAKSIRFCSVRFATWYNRWVLRRIDQVNFGLWVFFYTELYFGSRK